MLTFHIYEITTLITIICINFQFLNTTYMSSLPCLKARQAMTLMRATSMLLLSYPPLAYQYDFKVILNYYYYYY